MRTTEQAHWGADCESDGGDKCHTFLTFRRDLYQYWTSQTNKSGNRKKYQSSVNKHAEYFLSVGFLFFFFFSHICISDNAECWPATKHSLLHHVTFCHYRHLLHRNIHAPCALRASQLTSHTVTGISILNIRSTVSRVNTPTQRMYHCGDFLYSFTPRQRFLGLHVKNQTFCSILDSFL